MKSYLKRKNIFLVTSILGITAFYLLLYKIYIPRVSSFGCFDDCFNFMGGFFILQGKALYSEIFFNHAPGMAYLSAIVQNLTNPINLYDLILRHRQFMLLVSLLFNLILFLRYGYKMLGFILIFELSKFYVFGDRFLAEGIIVYPLIYLAGLGFEKIQKIKIKTYDYVLAAIFTWMVIFLREPYIPLTLFLFAVVMLDKNISKIKIYPLVVFISLSALTLITHNFSELFFNTIVVNMVFLSERPLYEILLKSFFYPFWIFLPGENTWLHWILIALCIPFLILTALRLKGRHYIIVGFVWTALFLSNLRPGSPGITFFAAFHMVVWYGLFIFFSLSLLNLKINRRLYYFLAGFYFLALILLTYPGRSYIYENVDPNTDLITNYGIPMQVGNVVALLADENDTLFLDGFDDIIYWVSKKDSDYAYSWYTSFMPEHQKYTDARTQMFQKNPPDFYYGTCLQSEVVARKLPEFVKNEYIRLNNSDKPSCLWVKKSKVPEITEAKWERAKQNFYSLPEES